MKPLTLGAGSNEPVTNECDEVINISYIELRTLTSKIITVMNNCVGLLEPTNDQLLISMAS